jgi:hypothetical protein
MNNLAYTIANDEFQFKSLLYKQYINKFQWSNEETKGRVHCGAVLPNFSYNVLEFHAYDSLALNYHPKDAEGFLFIINHLTSSNYVQLMTESNLMVDYSPRNVEIYLIPADKLFSFTFSPATSGKRTEFFLKSEALRSVLSPALIQFLQRKPFLPFSELVNDKLYGELCRQSELLYNHDPENIHTDIIFSLLSILKSLNDFAGKTTLANPLFPYTAVLNNERHYGPYKKIA